ncbi:MAG: CRTAC1 family protein, partial [Flavobacteriia bacterium]|nr:CRTAC1 family protein [Flavobacteriia bacterium]
MGASFSDYDNDGDMDVYLANHKGYGCLYNNNGTGFFTKVANDTTARIFSYSFGSSWGDIDNDGDEDLFVSNGFAPSTVKNLLFVNNGDGTFSRDDTRAVTQDAGWWFGNAFGDYDNDGFLDLAVANCHQGNGKSVLYHNLGNNNHWLEIKCVGILSNKSAIGTRVKVKSKINGNSVWQMREISSQSGYNGQNMLTTHFGLGDASKADTVKVIWPSGIID